MSKKLSDYLLIRLLSDELTKKELEELKTSSEYSLFKRIAETSSEFEVPDFDNKKQLFQEIEMKTYKKQAPVIALYKRWIPIAAASIMLLFGLVYFFNTSTNYSTEVGEQLVVVLPDNSEVLLNSKSSISFDKKNWNKTRIVKLTGEAYFKVEKGRNQFQVQSHEGNITVLGTQFNVNSKPNYLEVHCFEGKVKVNRKQVEEILTKGQVFRQINTNNIERWEIENQEPTWKNGETTFVSTPLKYVIASLQNNYQIDIKTNTININQVFTGSLSNTNLNVALQTLVSTMNLNFTFSENKKIIILNK